MYKKHNKEKIQIGDISVKKVRLKKLLAYIKYKYGHFVHDLDQVSEQQGLIDLVHENLLDVLRSYEGNYLYNRCLRLISIRPRSTKEIRQFIIKNADNPIIADDIIEHLGTFLNDEEFAKYLILKERSSNPKGNRVIEFKLKDKGIDDETIQRLLNEQYDDQALIQKQ